MITKVKSFYSDLQNHQYRICLFSITASLLAFFGADETAKFQSLVTLETSFYRYSNKVRMVVSTIPIIVNNQLFIVSMENKRH